MADDWEDWEDDNFVPPSVTAQIGNLNVQDKFADEDEGEVEDAAEPVEKPKPKSKEKKTYEDKGAAKPDQPLDDPVAEKLRQQRLVEEADFAAARELFGTDQTLDGFIPKTQKDFEEFARMIVHKYILPYSDNSNYKALIKSINKVSLVPVTAQEAKDVETAVAGIRTEKLKLEREAAKEKSEAGKKKTLNFGRGSAKKAADVLGDLDDYMAEDEDYQSEDDYDFM
uniref:Translation initiation factor eIF-3 subunit 1 n=1 Tax=Tetraselmis sp. GSL018 TaxID=582737 RepID=A0A061QWT3_9CHLO|mmetsp:Transcript_16997/g.40555  ORF Transcript_16997/g.40555 Transcript_16997/m.40555 type:complete len:226 (+) Transcript_16997:263-940(+)